MKDALCVVRGWGAIMTDDGPVCDVRDFPEGMTIREMQATDPAWRSWRWSSLRYGKDREGHTRGSDCRPGHPCKRCHVQAQSWWWEHGKRTKERGYMAVSNAGKTRENGWRKDEWGRLRTTLEEARSDASLNGWAWVVTMDGHGTHLEWTEVA